MKQDFLARLQGDLVDARRHRFELMFVVTLDADGPVQARPHAAGFKPSDGAFG